MYANKYKILQKLITTLWHEEYSFKFRLILSILLILMTSTLVLMLPWSLKLIVDKFSLSSSSSYSLIILLQFYVVLWILGQFLIAFRQIIVYRIFERGVRKLSMEVFEKILNLPLFYHIDKSTGALLNAIERAQAALPNVLFGLIFTVFPLLIEIAISLVFLTYFYESKYTIVLFFVFTSYFIFTWLSIDPVIKSQREGNKAHTNVSAFIADILMNIEYVRYQNCQKMIINKCQENMVHRENIITNQLIKMDLVYLGQIAIGGVGFIVLILLIGLDVDKGKLAVSDFVLFNGYLLQFLAPLNALGISVLRSIREGLTRMEDAMNIILTPILYINHQEENLILSDQPSKIEFKSVAFKYPENDLYILNDLNFTLEAGETAALIGTNGSGKSTITKLLYRFYEPINGHIFINDQDIKHFNLSSLREHIGIVPQDTLFLNDTLYANLVLDSDIPLSSPWFQEIMKKVKITPWVHSLSEGYETKIGEKGIRLSGGEKQRIAIARVLLRNPKIIILDEATSALDEMTETEILSELKTEFKQMSKLIITHNLKNLNFADKIINLNKIL